MTKSFSEQYHYEVLVVAYRGGKPMYAVCKVQTGKSPFAVSSATLNVFSANEKCQHLGQRDMVPYYGR